MDRQTLCVRIWSFVVFLGMCTLFFSFSYLIQRRQGNNTWTESAYEGEPKWKRFEEILKKENENAWNYSESCYQEYKRLTSKVCVDILDFFTLLSKDDCFLNFYHDLPQFHWQNLLRKMYLAQHDILKGEKKTCDIHACGPVCLNYEFF